GPRGRPGCRRRRLPREAVRVRRAVGTGAGGAPPPSRAERRDRAARRGSHPGPAASGGPPWHPGHRAHGPRARPAGVSDAERRPGLEPRTDRRPRLGPRLRGWRERGGHLHPLPARQDRPWLDQAPHSHRAWARLRVRPMSQFGRIRWRLAAWNLAILALVLAITIGAALVTETRARSGAVDRELRLAVAREIATFDHEGDDEGQGESRSRLESGTDLFSFWLDSRGQIIRNAQQITLTGLPDRDGVRAALGGQETLADRNVGGVAVRLLTVPAYHDPRIVGAVQVRKPLASGQRELAQLTTILLLTGATG